MENSIPKLRQTSIISEKPGFLTEKLKTWKRAPTAIEFNIFCWNFAHVFYLVMSTKGCVGFFVCRSWVINKSVKNECVETRYFLIFAITQDLNKIKSHTPFCRHWEVKNLCEVSTKNIEL